MAMRTVRSRPPRVAPWRALTAISADLRLASLQTRKPLERPVRRFDITVAPWTLPCSLNKTLNVLAGCLPGEVGNIDALGCHHGHEGAWPGGTIRSGAESQMTLESGRLAAGALDG